MEEAPPLIRLFHVYKRYGATTALTDITLDIGTGEFVFVTGASGAGKTTLLKLLYLGETPSQGQILIDGMNLTRIKRDRIPFLRRKFGVIFQDYNLIPTQTVFDNIALVLEVAGHKQSYIAKKVKSVLRTVGMEERMNSFPPALSGGEQQKITIARAIAGDPKILLADEPTGSLDDESAADVMALLQAFHDHGTTVIVATHNKNLIRTIDARRISLGRDHSQQETE